MGTGGGDAEGTGTLVPRKAEPDGWRPTDRRRRLIPVRTSIERLPKRKRTQIGCVRHEFSTGWKETQQAGSPPNGFLDSGLLLVLFLPAVSRRFAAFRLLLRLCLFHCLLGFGGPF